MSMDLLPLTASLFALSRAFLPPLQQLRTEQIYPIYPENLHFAHTKYPDSPRKRRISSSVSPSNAAYVTENEHLILVFPEFDLTYAWV